MTEATPREHAVPLWAWTAAVIALVAGLLFAVSIPTQTVIRPHDECFPGTTGACGTVTGPVRITHAPVRTTWAWLSLLPLAGVVVLYVVRQPSSRRMFLLALLVLFVSLGLAVLLPKLPLRPPECCQHFPAVVAWAIATVGIIVSIILFVLSAVREGEEKHVSPQS